MNLTWKISHFTELSIQELYDVFHLRIAVFVVEQNCSYQDADGKDQSSWHVMGFDGEGTLRAYSRILPAGISFPEASIGRVITSDKARGTGAGRELMLQSLSFLKTKFGDIPVRIGAQSYLKKFYSSFGFDVVSAEYLEDNIPHVEMLRRPD
ncbi:MAG TPA: GNAT family N-acetyltransferase [Bacteroidia bacterium]|jgi:ElaA protein|nr:GNAT family N-acetyltransferase [Bacteroidia bacterium]